MKLFRPTHSRVFALTGALLMCGLTAVAQRPGGGSGGSQPNQGGSGGTMNSPTPNTTNTVAPGETSPQDRAFLKDALEGGMTEVQLAQVALQKTANSDVKQYAQRMVDDHTKMGDQLKPIAEQIGVKVPDGLSKKDKAMVAKLQALNGDEFDKAYMKGMVKDHKADLNDFRIEADQGSNVAVKDAATQGVQVIQQHLQVAEQIVQKNGSVASSQ
jgi:putative membrane protein